MKVISEFNAISGLKLNKKKTRAMLIVQKKTIKPNPWALNLIMNQSNH